MAHIKCLECDFETELKCCRSSDIDDKMLKHVLETNHKKFEVHSLVEFDLEKYKKVAHRGSE